MERSESWEITDSVVTSLPTSPAPSRGVRGEGGGGARIQTGFANLIPFLNLRKPPLKTLITDCALER